MATKLSYEEYISIYDRVPRFCVELVIKNSEGEILFTLRDIPPKQGFYHLPGGTVLMDETVSDAVQRVAKEELGVKVEIIKLLDYLEYYQTDSVRGHATSLLFQVKVTEGEITLNDQASNFKFISQMSEDIMPEYKQLLKT